MLNLARGLVDLGYPVDLVVGTTEGPYRDLVPDGCHLVDLGAQRVLAALPGLVRYLRRRRPEVLLSAMDHANLIALWARSLARVPTRVAVSVRNHLSQEAKHAPSLAGRWLPRLARVFYPQAQVVIAVSQGVADDVNRLIGPGRVRVLAIPNPVVTPELADLAAESPDHAWLQPPSAAYPDTPPVILAAGRLTRQKDFPTLIRAFAMLSSRRDLRLLILGEGPERAALESLVTELGLNGRVALPGFSANPFAYMARARLFVLSSAWEGLPGVLIQAMACGTPVVSTDCPSGPREVLADGRYGPLVPVGDPEALALAVAETLEHPCDAALLRARANDFGLETVTGCYAAAMGLTVDPDAWCLAEPLRVPPYDGAALGLADHSGAATGGPRRLVHVITSLDRHGAQVMLYELIKATDPSRFHSAVISLSVPGPLQAQIADLGVPVYSLGISGGRPSLGGLMRLAHRLRALSPDLVQTWMYHADLLGGGAARLMTSAPVVWGLHNSNLDPRTTKWATRATVWSCARLSRLVPRRILSCSRVAMRLHRDLGYDAGRMVVIPNGFDLESYQPDRGHYAAIRAELSIAPDAILVGMVARYHPQKDHRNFINAAARVARHRPETRFVLVGEGVSDTTQELGALIRETGVAERFRLLGPRTDIPRLTAAFDCAVTSAAFGEAFPLVIGEAMACGVPCVATDVGDSALMVGETGRVVPPGDPVALARAIESVLCLSAEERRALGAAARQRIRTDYALPVIADRYQALYSELI